MAKLMRFVSDIDRGVKSEYVVIAAEELDPQKHKRPGYTFKNEADVDDVDVAMFPCDVTLWAEIL